MKGMGLGDVISAAVLGCRSSLDVAPRRIVREPERGSNVGDARACVGVGVHGREAEVVERLGEVLGEDARAGR